MSLKPFPILLLMISTLTHASMAAADVSPADQCRFIGIRAFTGFAVAPSSNANQRVLLSPVIKAPINWDELVVSWNAAAPAETWLKVEARGIYPDHETKFYTMGFWSRDSVQHPPEHDAMKGQHAIPIHESEQPPGFKQRRLNQ